MNANIKEVDQVETAHHNILVVQELTNYDFIKIIYMCNYIYNGSVLLHWVICQYMGHRMEVL